MHMRNLECAIVVFAKLRGVFCCVGVVCALFAFSSFSMCSTFSAFVYFGDFVGVKELKGGDYLRFVYIFRFGVGVVVV